MMHIFSHFCFWFFSIFLYLALRPVDIAMGTILAVVGAVSLLAIYFFMKGYKNGMAVRTLKLLQHIPFVKEWAKRFSENKREALERVDSQIAELHKQRRSTFYASLSLDYRMSGSVFHIEYSDNGCQFSSLYFNHGIYFFVCQFVLFLAYAIGRT